MTEGSRCRAKDGEIKENKYMKTKRERYPYNLGDSASLPSVLRASIYRTFRSIFVSIKYYFPRPAPRPVAVSFTRTVFHLIPPTPFGGRGGWSNRPCRIGLSSLRRASADKTITRDGKYRSTVSVFRSHVSNRTGRRGCTDAIIAPFFLEIPKKYPFSTRC